MRRTLIGLGSLAAVPARRGPSRRAAAHQDRRSSWPTPASSPTPRRRWTTAIKLYVKQNGDTVAGTEARVHPQGHRRGRARRRQAPRAGAGGARQGRHPRRLRAHAQRARGGGRVGRGEEAHGGDERRDLDHHHQVALPRAHLAHRAADRTRRSAPGPYKSGVKKVYTMVSDYGPGIDAEGAFQPRLQGGGRRDRRLGAHAGRESRLSPPSCSARRTLEPGGDLSSGCPAARSRARSARRWPSAASTRAKTKIMGQGELTDEEALKSMGDAALGIDHGLPLRLQPRFRR